jgi:hypothetical protein
MNSGTYRCNRNFTARDPAGKVSLHDSSASVLGQSGQEQQLLELSESVA